MISLPKHPEIKNIPLAVKQLTDVNFNFKKLIDVSLLNKVNHHQFIFLIGIASYSGENFKYNMSLIKKYIDNIGISNLETLLKLEINLHNVFLKRYETEESYNFFYNYFSQIYLSKIKKKKLLRTDNIKSVLFYVHSPTFLAHTNPMFRLLKKRLNKKIKVTIATYGYNKEFKKKCQSMDTEYYNISAENICDSFQNLKNIGSYHDRIIWVSLPVHLSYFRSIYENTCFWSLKFHPNIVNLKKYIGTFNDINSPEVLFNKNCWKNINLGFEVSNLREVEVNWKIRKLKFGSFCREELINDKNYWEIVKFILEENPKSKFYYCGKKQIHFKWTKLLNIEEQKIIFLGWLEKPHKKIKEMSFILDGFLLGHGLMGVEAMAASVPIIFPEARKSYGTSENFIRRSVNFFNIEDKKKYFKNYLLSFRDKSSLNHLSKKLLSDYEFNSFFGKHYKEIIKKYPSGSFEDLIQILK